MSATPALHRLSLAEASAAIASRQLRVSQYIEWLLSHWAGSEPAIHAWAHVDPQSVRAHAAAADLVHPSAQRPLHGMPIGVKDILDTASLPTAYGSAGYAAPRPRHDAACVARIAAAGGLLFGKTVTTEFAFMQPSATRNPWNVDHTPGGSSAGSAAAVAAGHVPAAVGTQTNGSVIRPAAFCGVVGFKPTFGAIDRSGLAMFSASLDTLGTFARNVADAARVASAIADSGRIAPSVVMRAKPPRIAFIERFAWTRIDIEAASMLDAAATRLRVAGAEVVAGVVPDAFDDAARVHRTLMLYEGARGLAHVPRDARSKVLAAALDEGQAIADADYRQALAAREVMRAAAVAWMSQFDAIMSAPAPGTAPASLDTTGDPAWCTLWSLVGAPAIALPIGLAGNRMPVGLQLASTPGADDALVSVAAWVEARLPFRGMT